MVRNTSPLLLPGAVVYISCPMNGKRQFNFPAINAAAENLRNRGCSVLSPAENFNGDVTLPYGQYLRKNFADVLSADVVVLLAGWRRSRRSRREVLVAQSIGLPVICFYTGRPIIDRLEVVLRASSAIQENT